MQNVTLRITFHLNDQEREVEIPAHISALSLLRDTFQLNGVKEGCGIGECGACTILVNNRAVNACLLLAAQLDGCNVYTVEGLRTQPEFQKLQEAFLNRHAVQCGFCTPGMLISAYALWLRKEKISRKDITAAVSGNVCRCTGYEQIVTAVEDMTCTSDQEVG